MAVPNRRQRQASSMQDVAENVGTGAGSVDDRFAGQLGYRAGGRRAIGGVPKVTGTAEVPMRGTVPAPVGSVLDGSLPPAPSMSLAELDDLAEPVFGGRDDSMDAPSGSLADHPLLRGLLLELPPKGAMPTAAWLDRWFEAARSILELLYVQHSDSRR
jgi:hypothetical protein